MAEALLAVLLMMLFGGGGGNRDVGELRRLVAELRRVVEELREGGVCVFGVAGASVRGDYYSVGSVSVPTVISEGVDVVFRVVGVEVERVG